MGILCCRPTGVPILECIHQLQSVEKTLQLLIDKYDKQILQERRNARTKMHRKADCLVHMRTIRMIRHHKQNLEARLESCMNKRYHLESLNVTQMHIRAVRTTTATFAKFLEINDVERVEALQETLTDMISDACEISETLEQDNSPLQVDEDELEEEYNALCAEVQVPTEIQMEFPTAPSKIPTIRNHPDELELMPLTSPTPEIV